MKKVTWGKKEWREGIKGDLVGEIFKYITPLCFYDPSIRVH